MKLISTKNIYKEYVTGEVVTKVLFDINLEVKAGEFVAIMGPSGSGKSTLMHILSFLDTPTSGEYYFHNKSVSSLNADELAALRNENAGFIFQTFNLLPRTTVYENVELPLLYTKKGTNKKLIMDAISAVGLEHRVDYGSNQLSGGEKQRVAIARAIVNEPEIIFADEPTGNLDSKTGTQIMEILQELNEHGRTIIMVTHEEDTAKHAKRIITLLDGRIVTDHKVNGRRFAKDGALKK